MFATAPRGILDTRRRGGAEVVARLKVERMEWINPKYGKKAVRKAGDLLIEPWKDLKAVSHALEVLSNWRSAHAYPIQAILMLVRGKTSKVDRSALIVQRLKRTPSILAKLRRESGMRLERMEDIGGCRAVVSTTKQARRVARLLVDSRTRHKLSRERDYILAPKESGYRGIHLVYRYHGEKNAFEGLAVEVQVRSKIQHSWATAVEVASAFTRHALKASQGPDEWLDYFKYASAELAKLEGCAVHPSLMGVDTASELERLSRKLDVQHRLRTFAVTTQNLGHHTRSKTDFFLIVLDMKASIVRVTRYAVHELDRATDKYATLEKQFRKNDSCDVVLVSASSISALKQGYPNYFADTAAFVGYLEQASRANNLIQRTRYAHR